MRSEFTVPLPLSAKSIDPAARHGADNKLTYRIRDLDMKQSRFERRLLVEPEIDLERYVFRAEIDWIWLEFETREKTQSIAIKRWGSKRLKREILVTGPRDKHNVKKPRNFTGQRFRLKMQDPEPELLRQLFGAIDAMRGVVGTVRIIGIEIAVDAYPAQRIDDVDVDLDRHRMVAALQRHHVAKHEFNKSPDANLREVYLNPDYPGKGKKKEIISFAIPDRKAKRRAKRAHNDIDVMSDEVRRRVLYPNKRSPLLIDSTLYLGAKRGDVMYRIQNKLMDGSDPDEEKRKLLPLRERRARIEVTLLNDSAREAGFTTLEELFGFNFVDLRKTHFQMCLPAVPAGDEPIGTLQRIFEHYRAKRALRAFKVGGCYRFRLHELAYRQNRRELYKLRRKHDPRVKIKERDRTGEPLIAWEEMTDNVGKALDNLFKHWSAPSELVHRYF